MLIGEMVLLVVAVFVMIGAAKGITARLGLNDYLTAFFIFVIVLLNVRGGVRLTAEYSLSLGGVLSVIVAFYTLFHRSEKGTDLLLAILSALGCAGIAFAYTLHFSVSQPLDARLLVVLLSLLVGLWCAFSAKRTFAACLFSAIVGSFIGVSLYQIFFQNSGNIGGNYSFTLMWSGAIFGLLIQYLLTVMLRAVKSPRANSYFEAGEMQEEERDKKLKE